MGVYEEAMRELEARFGGGKDNVIAVSTLADGRPQVRMVDAYYEDGAFYAVTNAGSSKIRQLAADSSVAVASAEWFTAEGRGENLGWVMKGENAALRDRLRSAFSAWYDMANDENSKDCVILAVKLLKGRVIVNHFEKVYTVDFAAKTAEA